MKPSEILTILLKWSGYMAAKEAKDGKMNRQDLQNLKNDLQRIIDESP